MTLAGPAPEHKKFHPDREGHNARCSLLFRADTSLPPGIPGTPKGEILLQFRWTGAPRRDPPGSQQAAVTWWGQRRPRKVVDLQTAADTGLVYSITCGPKAFSRYLRDMQQLKIEYIVHANSIKASTVTGIDVSKLDLSKSTTSRTPITASDGRLLGTAVVSISISYSHLVSSFEMNEHLASVDCNMPLFPTQQRVLTPLRQLNLESASNVQHQAFASDQCATSAVDSCLPNSVTSVSAEAVDANDKQSPMLLDFSELQETIDRCCFCLLTLACIGLTEPINSSFLTARYHCHVCTHNSLLQLHLNIWDSAERAAQLLQLLLSLPMKGSFLPQACTPCCLGKIVLLACAVHAVHLIAQTWLALLVAMYVHMCQL